MISFTRVIIKRRTHCTRKGHHHGTTSCLSFEIAALAVGHRHTVMIAVRQDDGSRPSPGLAATHYPSMRGAQEPVHLLKRKDVALRFSRKRCAFSRGEDIFARLASAQVRALSQLHASSITVKEAAMRPR